MFKPRLISIAAALAALAFGASAAGAHAIEVSFAEMAQTSDLIFVGTVESQSCRMKDTGSMIYTDVTFTNVETVGAAGRSKQNDSRRVLLSFPGGAVGGLTVSLCGQVRLETGRRYVLFALDDGAIYTSPLVGGPQGLFEVVRDRRTGEEFVLTSTHRAVVDVVGEDLISSTPYVAAIDGGRIVPASSGEVASMPRVEPPIASNGTHATPSVGSKRGDRERPLDLRSFVRRIKTVALKAPLTNRVIRREPTPETGAARLAAEADKRPSPRPLVGASAPDSAPVPLSNGPALGGESGAPGANEKLAGGPLFTCGYHDLYIVMEQYPTSWPEWNIANECMSTWNYARDVFRWKPDDGTFGRNNVNEFVGYPSSATKMSVYGTAWNPSFTGVTVTYMDGLCGKIVESDIALNPSFSWSDDLNQTIVPGGPVNIRAALMHELGHVWGFMSHPTTPETYDYDRTSVMHRDSDVVEDGRGIHAVDAELIRRVYGQQDVATDVGVESYFAQNGLQDSTIDGTTFRPGDTIALGNVTVENMANYEQEANVVFYLSTDNEITTDDIELETYWTIWFPPVCEARLDFTPVVPAGVPHGTYYVGAIITLSGFRMDDTPWNNTTFFKTPILVPLPFASPVIDRVESLQRPSRPFLIRLYGSGFDPNLHVFIGGQQWDDFRVENSGLVELHGGDRLMRLFPRGFPVPIRVVNPDGGAASVTFTR